MSNGHTMVDNVMAEHGLDQDVEYEEGYLAAEDQALQEEEEKMIHEDEDLATDEEKMDRHMLTTVLVNSVIETSNKAGQNVADDPSQRYSLRKRRRPTGETSEKLEDGDACKEKGSHYSPQKPTTSELPVSGVARNAAQPIESVPPSAAPDPARTGTASFRGPGSPKAKTNGAPAVTVPTTSALSAPVPPSSSLPLALRPPPIRSLSGKASKPIPTPGPRIPTFHVNATAKPKQRLALAAQSPVPRASLATDTVAYGVPNPLSNPFPMATASSIANGSGTGAQKQRTFKSGTKLTVPNPLPCATLESNVQQAKSPHPGAPNGFATTDKKKVTISNEVPDQARGRIFSIDLDPASLDFSILDPNPESGSPAPASADLSLLADGSRDRAYSFECFAFGINADEPLSSFGEHGQSSARPRGDSIIFDPVSFQEGGIHEEHALSTRESRGMSIDLDSIVASVQAPPQASHPDTVRASKTQVACPPKYAEEKYATPAVLSSAPKPQPMATMLRTSRLDNASAATGNSSRSPPPQQRANDYPTHPGYPIKSSNESTTNGNVYNHEQVSSAINTQNGNLAIVGSTSTTLQMELLNKDGRIGIYLPEARRERIARFHAKRKMRIWRKRIKYDCRKKLADSRPRIKGRFVKRTDMDD